MIETPTSDMERFMRNVSRPPDTDCWLWTAGKFTNGYGRHYEPNTQRGTRAHRMAWRLFRGEVPGRLRVLHHCDVRLCVNPDHLFLGTDGDNARDRARKGRSGNQWVYRVGGFRRTSKPRNPNPRRPLAQR